MLLLSWGGLLGCEECRAEALTFDFSASKACCRIFNISSSDSFASTNTLQRDNRAPVRLNEGLLVVAPIKVIMPASTGPSSTSCCDLLKRCISSQNMMVFRPVNPSSLWACAKSFLHSATPVLALLTSTKRVPAAEAIRRAIVVLPDPGEPQRIIDGTLPAC